MYTFFLGKKMCEYRPLGHDGEGDVSINGTLNCDLATGDDTPVIKPVGSLPLHLEPMSPLRKVSFVLSILFCGMTIVMFLWVLPCGCGTCLSAPLRSGTKSWERTLRGLGEIMYHSVSDTFPNITVFKDLHVLTIYVVMTHSVLSSRLTLW
jgi:hypothetical protein